MTDDEEIRTVVDQFVLDEIDGVPHLEALLSIPAVIIKKNYWAAD